ncbi:helix-turn-helix domain-containing protein [Vibrio sp. S11_S32]|uniref:helix-turn-helix domain-containing protein n=1 Tax=Vibrio sp. S11_S32 TaxID=2720225 RepID=UPI0016816AA8|nr:XRE family transcriptional regulator [Vibrio sp. S11_S32]MBD1577029.1 helix-turn-helix domain-containing protein [Vibrio sp. S11_S32]
MKFQSDDSDQTLTPLDLGQRLKDIRLQMGLTLEEASKRTGLARSTLSKMENSQISPTFQALQKLATGLDMPIPQIFEPPKQPSAVGRRDITLKGQGKPHPTSTYEHELLASQLSNKKMVPFKSRIRSRHFDDYQEWIRHDGEEFLLVLEGEVRFYCEFYEPVDLKEGDSVYYDASMGHTLISTGENDGLILWVTAK